MKKHKTEITVPPLRFKGFDGGWEEKRLEAIVTFSKGKGYSKSDITEEGYPLFLYGRMYTNYQIEVASVETFCKLRDGSVLSKGGEVVCPASGETAEDIACASAVVEKGIVLGGDLNILTPRKDADLDSVFLALSLTYGTPRNVIKSRAQGKTVVHIHNLDFADIGVFNPSLPEQQKLGEVFRSMDALITSHETALVKLKALKKAMLEKMFPRAGAKVPEVRFKGFVGEWEEKRLDAIVTFSKGKGYSKSDITEEGYPLFLYGRMYTNYQIEVSSVETFCKFRDGSVLSKGGEVICPASGETAEDIACASAVTEKGIVLGGDLNILTPCKDADFDSVFLAMCLTYGTAHNAIKSRAQGNTVVHVHNSDFIDIDVFMPSLPEQRKIGAYFRSLDALISARRDEIAKLKDLKKALLDRMFV